MYSFKCAVSIRIFKCILMLRNGYIKYCRVPIVHNLTVYFGWKCKRRFLMPSIMWLSMNRIELSWTRLMCTLYGVAFQSSMPAGSDLVLDYLMRKSTVGVLGQDLVNEWEMWNFHLWLSEGCKRDYWFPPHTQFGKKPLNHVLYIMIWAFDEFQCKNEFPM